MEFSHLMEFVESLKTHLGMQEGQKNWNKNMLLHRAILNSKD